MNIHKGKNIASIIENMCITHGTQWDFLKNFENNFFRS
jgi:hypothetical protein